MQRRPWKRSEVERDERGMRDERVRDIRDEGLLPRVPHDTHVPHDLVPLQVKGGLS